MSHTPGPWIVAEPGEVDEHYAVLDGFGHTASVYGYPEEAAAAAANARLIAAAPELLEACELLLIYLGDWNDMEDETCAAARRAIAKARGQEVPNG